MTVKELEDALGMTRANIRYYEREGLLAPSRQENGYRDYSREDLEQLRKIKLLRQLRFSVEEIRDFQSGARDLTAALARQEARLAREAGDLMAARAVCRSMEEEGAGFAGLDAAKYLDQVTRLTGEGNTFPGVDADVLPTVIGHPWVRWLARTLDFTLYRVALLCGSVLLTRTVLPSDPLLDLILSYLVWGVAFLVEPLLLSTWGTTPGKWIMGLTVRDACGDKLTWKAAATRLRVLFGKGEGWGIPFYDLYRNYKSYKACMDGQTQPWDEDVAYTLADTSPLRAVGCAAAWAAGVLVTLASVLSITMPLHRGPVTVAEFSENYNEYYRQIMGQEALYRLDSQGRWEKRDSGGTVVILGSDGPPAELEFTLDGDIVTGVSFRSQDPPGLWGGGAAPSLELTALCLLGRQADLFHWYGLSTGLSDAMGGAWESYRVDYGGLTIVNDVAYSGYDVLGGGYFFPRDGEEQSYCQSFSVTVN